MKCPGLRIWDNESWLNEENRSLRMSSGGSVSMEAGDGPMESSSGSYYTIFLCS